MLKYPIKYWLEQQDWYYRMRYSDTYFYWQKRLRPNLARALAQELKLYQSALGNQSLSLIFDIGASEGYTAKNLLSLSKKLICIEPASKNIKALNARFDQNERVTILHQAVGAKKGKAQLHLANRGATLHTLSSTWKKTLEEGAERSGLGQMNFSDSEAVEVNTLDGLIAEYGRPDFIKIDVEGFELEVLRGLSQAIPLISFEANLPTFQTATLECIDRLLSLNPKATFNYSYKEQLEWPEFGEVKRLQSVILHGQLQYLEIFCKMPI